MANRHGLITGATGMGKTVTLQRMAEQLSMAGGQCWTLET
nr:helicase HerA-like domain-containing protein [Rugosibacter aromaticivorans]